MILYNVTVNVDDAAAEEWVVWMKTVHIPEVLDTGMFLSNRFCRLMIDEESGVTYSVQYVLKDLETFKLYQQVYAPALQKSHHEKYEGKYVAFRTVMEILDETQL
jgi:hypothetical protein